ncbi:MAG: hypothetical protein KA171_12565 [Reyranella sp.]|nr:hypothetical protein [Reyranella sp.]
MTKTEQLMQERDDLKAKIASANKSSDMSDREASDLKMMEQELLALGQRIAREESGKATPGKDKPRSVTETIDRKLDAALKDSFPGSDPVSSIEPAPARR